MNQKDNLTNSELFLIPYRKGDTWGFCDQNRKLVIEAKYTDAHSFSDGLALAYSDEGCSFLDKKGSRVISIRQDYKPRPFRNGLAGFSHNGKCGFIDKKGNVVVQPTYDVVEDFSSAGVASVRAGELLTKTCGLIDNTGKEIIPTKYDAVVPLSERLLRVSSDKVCALFDTEGNQVTDFKYWSIEPFSEGLAVVKEGSSYGYIDTDGREVIPPQYADAKSFKEGLALVQSRRSKWGFIDGTNRKIIPLKYENARSFSEGMAMVTPLSKLVSMLAYEKPGFIDKSGNIVISLSKDFVLSPNRVETGFFSEGLAFVSKRYGNTGYYELCVINRWGNEITEPKYEHAGLFLNGLAPVQFDTGDRWLWGFVDKHGREVIPPKFTDEPRFIDGLARVEVKRKDDWMGLSYYIDKNGTEYYEP